MLTLQLGTSKVHALAFSPDSSRLAVASGRKLAVVDWRAPGEPTWWGPPRAAGCRVTTLSFSPDGVKVLAGYGAWPLVTLDGATGEVADTFRGFVGSRIVTMAHRNVVVAASDPPAVLACGFVALPRPAEVFALPSGGGLPLARLNLFLAYDSPQTVRDNYPLSAWVVRQDRLLVWCKNSLRWFSWPPPATPAPSTSFWGTLSSALTGVSRAVTMPVNDLINRGTLTWAFAGVRPIPPDLQLLKKHEFPYPADAVAPLPDGDTLLVAHKGALVRWHAPTGTELARWRWPGMQALRSLAVSPDGTVAAVGGNGGRVIVWDLDV